MGIYTKHLAPRLINLACGSPAIQRWRRDVCVGLRGTVVEIGFGSGHNVPFYPDEVTNVLALEPSSLAWRLGAKRIAASVIPIEQIGLDGQSIPLLDQSCDAALLTFTLCTIPDPAAALLEIIRVLRPGGELHFLEHGLAPDAKTALRQHRLDPLEQRLADGCRLTRRPLELITSAGFISQWKHEQFVKGPKPWSYFTLGVVTRPAN
jgi:SAM-dependent methyltransferase